MTCPPTKNRSTYTTVILRCSPSWASLEGWKQALVAHPSRLAVKNGEHLRMMVVGDVSMMGTPPDAFASGALAHLSYFTAEKRLSNELAGTIGCAPATRASFAGGAAAGSETVG